MAVAREGSQEVCLVEHSAAPTVVPLEVVKTGVPTVALWAAAVGAAAVTTVVSTAASPGAPTVVSTAASPGEAG